MEVVIGFAVGYLVGTRQGRQGIQKALDSAQAIWASPETKRLLSEGLTAFETVAAPAMDRMGGQIEQPPGGPDQHGGGRAHRAAPGPPRGVNSGVKEEENRSGMHEYGLAEGVLATVRQRADGRKVAGIRVRFGVRHAVDQESMAQAFSFVAEGTEAAGATVELVTVPATITCRDCGLAAETSDVLAVCPRCAGENVEITGGDEMTLESITYEPVPARGSG